VSRSSVSCNKINIADYLYPGCADSSELVQLNDVDLPTSLLDALTPDVALPSRILQTEKASRDILRIDSRVPKPIAEPPPGPGVPSKTFLGKLYTPHDLARVWISSNPFYQTNKYPQSTVLVSTK